ncbi:MAG: bacteriohemerythrin [Thermodesulfobacteriota bacterium]
MESVFVWTEDYSVGVEDIDDQHKKIFQFINELSDCLAGGGEKQAVEDIVMQMVDYVVYHFRTEEKYLFGHPDFASHRRQHNDFSQKALACQESVIEDPEVVGREAVAFLQSWLNDHILYVDKRIFADLMKDTG